mmetsp:Transcript_30746/g.29621  ORF Transcript_30746/g.29621 Transcript_30746/m.29621 type:complete len:83 (+) Transcript_30746:13-261(+)
MAKATTTTTATSTTNTDNDDGVGLSTRTCLAVFVVTPIVWCQWDNLLRSLDGSYFKAILIVICAYGGTLIDLNDMVGQPHED